MLVFQLNVSYNLQREAKTLKFYLQGVHLFILDKRKLHLQLEASVLAERVQEAAGNPEKQSASNRLYSGDTLSSGQVHHLLFLWSRSNNRSYLSKLQSCLTLYAAETRIIITPQRRLFGVHESGVLPETDTSLWLWSVLSLPRSQKNFWVSFLLQPAGQRVRQQASNSLQLLHIKQSAAISSSLRLRLHITGG